MPFSPPRASWLSVHPHVRGADETGAIEGGTEARFIPTCVGQIVNAVSYGQASRGSSPRAWGRCLFPRLGRLGFRFIPTCVGQMRQGPLKAAQRRGSSPRAWGRLTARSTSSGRSSVHPHVRGADSCDLLSRRLSCTVHPHVRGADVKVQSVVLALSRFIPTCVGQILSRSESSLPPTGSSPRAWGRYFMMAASCRIKSGSSPRAWGRWAGRYAAFPIACGSSPRAWGRWCVHSPHLPAVTVHPHVRGADFFVRKR